MGTSQARSSDSHKNGSVRQLRWSEYKREPARRGGTFILSTLMSSEKLVKLNVFVKRKPGLSHEEFFK